MDDQVASEKNEEETPVEDQSGTVEEKDGASPSSATVGEEAPDTIGQTDVVQTDAIPSDSSAPLTTDSGQPAADGPPPEVPRVEAHPVEDSLGGYRPFEGGDVGLPSETRPPEDAEAEHASKIAGPEQQPASAVDPHAELKRGLLYHQEGLFFKSFVEKVGIVRAGVLYLYHVNDQSLSRPELTIRLLKGTKMVAESAGLQDGAAGSKGLALRLLTPPPNSVTHVLSFKSFDDRREWISAFTFGAKQLVALVGGDASSPSPPRPMPAARGRSQSVSPSRAAASPSKQAGQSYGVMDFFSSLVTNKAPGVSIDRRVVLRPTLPVGADGHQKDPLLVALGDMLSNPMYTDVGFVVEGRSVRAHRGIIVSRIPKFEEIFSTGETTFEVTDSSFAAFNALLQYVYLDRVEVDVTLAAELIPLAMKYEAMPLARMCASFVVDAICVEHVCYLYTLGVRHHVDVLVDRTVSFIISNFDEVAQTDGFQALDGATVKEFVRLRSSSHKG